MTQTDAQQAGTAPTPSKESAPSAPLFKATVPFGKGKSITIERIAGQPGLTATLCVWGVSAGSSQLASKEARALSDVLAIALTQ